MADVVLNDRLEAAGLADRVEVVSAGTGGWHVGDPMDRRAAALLTSARVRRHPAPRPAVRRRLVRRPRPGARDGRRQPRRPRRDGAPATTGSGCSATSTRARPTTATGTCPTLLRRRRRLRGGARDGRAHRRRAGRRRSSPAPRSTRRGGGGRLTWRGWAAIAHRAETLLGTAVVATTPGRRRRHLHRHPAPALRRPLRAGEDPAARARRTSSPPRPRGLRWLGRGRRGRRTPRCSPSRTTA